MTPMKKAVYLAGSSGSGKTTFSLLASGITLLATRREIQENVPEELKKIGNDKTESKTSLPEAFKTKSSVYALDTPGTGDSRSKEYQIAN